MDNRRSMPPPALELALLAPLAEFFAPAEVFAPAVVFPPVVTLPPGAALPLLRWARALSDVSELAVAGLPEIGRAHV